MRFRVTMEGFAMSSATLRWALIASILFTGMTGCGYFRGGATDDDTELTDLDELEKADPIRSQNPVVAENAPPLEGVLELNLKVNDRFPMSKTVEHRLTQTDQGRISVNTSLTDLMLSLVVNEIRPDGRKLLTVHYHKVQYQQDIGGKKIAYSSDRPADAIPPDAYLYAGLANNGFQFWIGPNNKIVEIVGFNDFLKRCLRNVPEKYVASVQQQLENTKTEDGVANFIDDSIGLLPYSNDPGHPGVAVKEGTRWDLEPRRSEAPIPMLVTTQCMLKELTANSAEILLSGRITGPPTPVAIRSADGNVKVLVKGGYCTGMCLVDRASGLPTQSRVQRSLELAMEFPGGQTIKQDKETVSTIRSYLSQPQPTKNCVDTAVDQTSFRNADGGENHRRVIHAGGLYPK